MATESGSGTPFPQTGSNRELGELLMELSEHVGMGDDADAQQRALRSLQRAVNKYNTCQWKFNQTSQDVTLVADTDEYDLDGTFNLPMRAIMLDTNDVEVFQLEFRTLRKKLDVETSNLGATTIPDVYFMFNLHKRGKVRFWPTIGPGPFPYPKCRLYYFSRIEVPNVTTGKLNVPEEVEEAILAQALAHFMRKEKGAREARDDFLLAAEARNEVEVLHRDFSDYARATGRGH